MCEMKEGPRCKGGELGVITQEKRDDTDVGVGW